MGLFEKYQRISVSIEISANCIQCTVMPFRARTLFFRTQTHKIIALCAFRSQKLLSVVCRNKMANLFSGKFTLVTVVQQIAFSVGQ